MNEVKDKSNKKGLMFAIVGVMTLVVAVAGSTYAYYAASVSRDDVVQGNAGGGAAPVMNLAKITEDTTKLIPIAMNQKILDKAAKANPKCKDKNGYTACQIYSVSITNKGNNDQIYDINLTSLTGTNTPHIEAISMGKVDNAVSNATSIKNNGTICQTTSVAAGGTSDTCYFMVFIKNTTDAQTDNGGFSGVVTATSTTGAKTEAQFQ